MSQRRSLKIALQHIGIIPLAELLEDPANILKGIQCGIDEVVILANPTNIAHYSSIEKLLNQHGIKVIPPVQNIDEAMQYYAAQDKNELYQFYYFSTKGLGGPKNPSIKYIYVQSGFETYYYQNAIKHHSALIKPTHLHWVLDMLETEKEHCMGQDRQKIATTILQLTDPKNPIHTYDALFKVLDHLRKELHHPIHFFARHPTSSQILKTEQEIKQLLS